MTKPLRELLWLLTLSIPVLVPPVADYAVRAERLDGPAQDSQTEVSIIMSNPANHPKLGLPDLVVQGTDQEVSAAAKILTDVLWNDLDFEREYYMIQQKVTASIPATSAETLPYAQWREVGADFVLAGVARRRGNDFQVDFRILATRADSEGRQTFGKCVHVPVPESARVRALHRRRHSQRHPCARRRRADQAGVCLRPPRQPGDGPPDADAGRQQRGLHRRLRRREPVAHDGQRQPELLPGLVAVGGHVVVRVVGYERERRA